jgi:hypothetical protein
VATYVAPAWPVRPSSRVGPNGMREWLWPGSATPRGGSSPWRSLLPPRSPARR